MSSESGVGMSSRGRWVAWISAAVVVVLVGAAAITWAALRTRGGPVEAVRDYVDLIAAGDAVGASQLVDPEQYTGYDGESNPESDGSAPRVSTGAPVTASDDLVLDRDMMAVIASEASQRIEVADVALDYGDSADVPVGESVDVEVTYLLRDVTSTAVLRAERLDDTWFGFTQWRVVDPLLVPLVVQSNAPELGPAEVRDDEDRNDRAASAADTRDAVGSSHPAVRVPAEIDLSGPDAEGASQRATLLYPGVYRIGGTTSTYLTAPAKSVVVAGAAAISTASEGFGDVVSTSLWFEPTQALSDRISEEATAFVASCFAAMPTPPADCPSELRARSGFATEVVLDDAPVLDDITSYQTEHVDGIATEPAVRATFTTGRFDFTSDDGRRDDAIFFLYAWVHPDGDDVTIEFRPSL